MSEVSRDLETWLPVADYDGFYEVGNWGSVRSVTRTQIYQGRWGATRRTWPSRLLQPIPIWDGHLRVTLARVGIRDRFCKIHLLVLEAFVGPRPPGLLGCHEDGDPTNNHVSNLRWDTAKSNSRDTVDHGHHFWAEKSECPREHLLVAPNLMPSQLRLGMRSCLACSRAHPAARKLGVTFDRPEFKVIADRYYEQIMRSAA